MRVGIDARFFGPENKGLGRYTQKLITHLEEIDHTNEYVIFLRRENFNKYNPRNKNFTKICADYQWYSFAEQIFFPIILYKQKCDVIHFPHFNVPLLYRKRFIVTIHDLILFHYPTRKNSTRMAFFYWIKFFAYRVVITRAVQKARTIIAVSHFTKKDICTHFSSVCQKVVVIYESAEICKKTKENETKILAKYDIIKPYMLYVGNAYIHKNLFMLVDAFARYRVNGGAIQNLVLVGRNDYFYKRLRAYIDQKKIKGIIIVNGVSDEKLYILYKEAFIFVFPSLYEGFGLPPLEAQLLGLPVLSSDHACMKEILSREGAYYCDATDIHTFAYAMREITENTALRDSLCKKGYQNAQRFSWKKMAQETHNVYQK